MNTAMKILGGRNLHVRTDNRFLLSLGLGGGHYCDNYDLGYDAETDFTKTMEVAIMYGDDHSSYKPDEGFGCHFVVIPQDVVGYVSIRILGDLIEAVECADWERVLFLCGFTGEPDFDSFPDKHQEV
jgi:hypothetical protein|tara:strand:- start:179 stop:559 length:381 start_codon:yes stop_codon:yes gene_type:complete